LVIIRWLVNQVGQAELITGIQAEVTRACSYGNAQASGQAEIELAQPFVLEELRPKRRPMDDYAVTEAKVLRHSNTANNLISGFIFGKDLWVKEWLDG
jgi:hypothetical protein